MTIRTSNCEAFVMASAHSVLSFSQLAARLRTGPSAGMRARDSAFGLSATTSDAYATVAPVDPGLFAIGLRILREEVEEGNSSHVISYLSYERNTRTFSVASWSVLRQKSWDGAPCRLETMCSALISRRVNYTGLEFKLVLVYLIWK